ncbi:hypothetical protein BH24ACT4_BH24ACT4_15990 [soil metagenome]
MADAIIPILRVTDAARAAGWYQRWGFEVTGEHRFGPGMPTYLFLERNGAQLHLSEHAGDAPPASLVYCWVDDVDAVAAELGAEIEDQPWGREVEATDPDGNRLRIATRSSSDEPKDQSAHDRLVASGQPIPATRPMTLPEPPPSPPGSPSNGELLDELRSERL